jgi:hypothetical protein
MKKYDCLIIVLLLADLLDDDDQQQVRQAREHPPHRHLLGQAVSQSASHGSSLQTSLQEHPLLR